MLREHSSRLVSSLTFLIVFLAPAPANYALLFAAHGAPQPDNDCIVCCDPLDEAQYCEYQTRENGPWFPCMYCKNCMVDSFLNRQFAMYLDNLKVRLGRC